MTAAIRNTSFEALQDHPKFRRLAAIVNGFKKGRDEQLLEEIKNKGADAITLQLLVGLWESASVEAQETFRLHIGQGELFNRAQNLIEEQWGFIQWLVTEGKGKT